MSTLTKTLPKPAASRTRQAAEIQQQIAALQAKLNRILSNTTPEKVRFDPDVAGHDLAVRMQETEGGSWTGTELERRFGLTPATLHRRRKEHRIVFWRDALHEFHYPRWQFTPTGALLCGLQEVLEVFRSQDEWRIMRYFLGPREQFGGRRALDLLRAGEVGKVLAHAKTHAAENTW